MAAPIHGSTKIGATINAAMSAAIALLQAEGHYTYTTG